ncbi:RNA methyltransferase [Candidatus Palauibacter sp.]|uniref:RNA methyltransferase n=1 Tax=Candidatus Palauibacter sp. TaxID=3101350 RepID=UPI003B5CA690
MSAGGTQLDRTVIVLHEPQDVVNIALVVRAMKNMGLARLRLVNPAEFDAWRITGIAHDTRDVVERIRVFEDLPSALADVGYALGATARRRSTRQDWWNPEQAATRLTARGAPLAVVFGREDRGLSNEALDLCHGLVCIPTNPDHSSMNLAHAAVILMYELRKAAIGPEDWTDRDLSLKKRRQTPPALHSELEAFFGKWQRAMEEIGLFHGIDPVPKMRSFRNMFQRADLDRRELGLILAAAYEVLHFAEREKKRARDRAEAGG